MQEVYDLDQWLNWASIGFLGGISGCQTAPCGSISSGVVALGLICGKGATGREEAREARKRTRLAAQELYEGFERRFGHTICRDLTGRDFSLTGEFEDFVASGAMHEKCDQYVGFVVKTILELLEKKAEG